MPSELLSEFVANLIRTVPNLTVQEVRLRAKRAGYEQNDSAINRAFYSNRSRIRNEEDRPIPADTVQVVTEQAGPVRETDTSERNFNEMMRVHNLSVQCGGVQHLTAVLTVVQALGVERVHELVTYLRAMEHTQCELGNMSSISSDEREMATA